MEMELSRDLIEQLVAELKLEQSVNFVQSTQDLIDEAESILKSTPNG